MERDSARLGEAVAFASGLIGLDGQDGIVSDSKRGSTWKRGIDSGGDVLPYRVRYAGKYLNFSLPHLKSGFKDARYDEPKIMMRQTGDSLIAAYDPDSLLCLNNVHVGNQRDRSVDLRVIVALLNSEMMNRFYRTIALETNRAMAQTDIDVLEDLPLKKLASAQESEVVALVSRLQSTATSANEASTCKRQIETILRDAYGVR